MSGMDSDFNIFIAVDWSAKNTPSPAKPSADAIWVAVKDTLAGEQYERYFRTRFSCESFLLELLHHNARKENARILIGYDLDFGFPAGLAKSMGVSGLPWQYHWKTLSNMIQDNEKNKNNRFQVASFYNQKSSNTIGPFWGVPKAQETDYLKPKSPSYPFQAQNGATLRHKRWCESKEPKAQPVWKLLGTASVGGQSLMGILVIHRLRHHNDLKDMSAIWPLETGFNYPENSRIVHVEIWPGLFSKHLDGTLEVKDHAQVRYTVDWLDMWVRSGKMSTLMAPPAWLTASQIEDVEREEGWVIGSGLEGRIFPEEIKEYA